MMRVIHWFLMRVPKMDAKAIAIRKSLARRSKGRGGLGHSALITNPGKAVHLGSRAVGLSAAALILVSACSSGGGVSSGGSAPASTPLTPGQAMLAAAIQAHKVTSATETVTIQDSGIQNTTTTATAQFRRTPTLQLSENLHLALAGKSTPIKLILTGTAIYVHEPSLARQIGKPWLEVHLAALNKSPGAFIAQMVHSLQSNNFVNQVQVLAVVKNVRVAGKQTVHGVPTTEYAGSFHAAQALGALGPGFRKAMAPAFQVLGNRTVTFHAWVDGRHQLQKMTERLTINSETISTTINITAINQPVQITLPPANQTFTPPGG